MKKFLKYTLTTMLAVPACVAFFSNDSYAKGEASVKNKSDVVNVRAQGFIDDNIISQVTGNDKLTVYGKSGEWLRVAFKDKNAFVNASYFDVKGEVGEDILVLSEANFRKADSKEAEVLEVLPQGTIVSVIEDAKDGYQKVDLNGKIGYVHNSLLGYEPVVEEVQTSAQENTQNNNYSANNYNNNTGYSYNNNANYNYKNTASNNNKTYQSAKNTSGIYAYASQYVGNPYVWGGNSLTSGTDCSGFTQSVYSNYGVKLPHNAQAQYGYGKDVSKDEIKEGDLVFYGTSTNNITHVAIADGKGGIVHASNPSTGITTGNIGNPVGVKRLNND